MLETPQCEPRRPSSLACARGVVTAMGLVAFAARCAPLERREGREERLGVVAAAARLDGALRVVRRAVRRAACAATNGEPRRRLMTNQTWVQCGGRWARPLQWYI